MKEAERRNEKRKKSKSSIIPVFEYTCVHRHQKQDVDGHVCGFPLFAIAYRSGLWAARSSSQRISCFKIPFLFLATPSR